MVSRAMVYEWRQRFKYGRTDICNDEFIHYIARILHLCISLSLLSYIQSQICLNKSTKCHNRQYNLTNHCMKIYLNNYFKKIYFKAMKNVWNPKVFTLKKVTDLPSSCLTAPNVAKMWNSAMLIHFTQSCIFWKKVSKSSDILDYYF